MPPSRSDPSPTSGDSSQLREAESSYRRGVALSREWLVRSVGLPGVSPQYQIQINIDRAIAENGMVKARQGRLAEGEADVRRALLSRLKASSKYNLDTAWVVAQLANLMVEQGRYTDAEMLSRAVLQIYQTLRIAGDSQALATALNDLASILNLQGRWPEPAQLCAAVDAATRTWEPARRDALRLNIGHILTLYNTNNIDAGIAASERLRARQRSVFGEQNPETAVAGGLLAIGLARAGRDAGPCASSGWRSPC
jgi:hypothetical protein